MVLTNVEKILTLARSQIGIKESPKNSNNVKYNTWYYGHQVFGSSYPWCMVFVQWVFEHAKLSLPYLTASCGGLLRWYRKNDPECIVDIPFPGDIVIFDFPGRADTDHTGILERIVAHKVITIDGNTGPTNEANGGAVMRRERHINNVRAFIRPRCLWEEEAMTGEEIYAALNDYLKDQPLPNWAKAEYEEAVKMGITDGTDPCVLIPRYQCAIMALRAMKKREG